MDANETPNPAVETGSHPKTHFKPGDWVVPRTGYPILCEVITEALLPRPEPGQRRVMALKV